MWFMNHIWNPFVRFILRSPLHGLLSRSVMLITYQGRKSGKTYTVPVSYLEDGDTIYVLPGMPEKKVWWRNIQQDTPVSLRVRGREFPAKASLLSPEKDLGIMVRALGLFFVKMPAGTGLYKVRKDAAGNFIQEDMQRAAGGTVMICARPVQA